MTEPGESIRRVLAAWSRFDPGFRLDGDRLVVLDPQKTLASLRRYSLDLIVPAVCRVDDSLVQVLEGRRLEEEVFRLAQTAEARRIIDLHAEAGVGMVVLKGLSLIPYYPAGCLRTSYDADLLIDPQDKHRSVQVFRDAGYEPVFPDDFEDRLARRGEMEWRHPTHGQVVECHWDLIGSPSLRARLDFSWDLVRDRIESLVLDDSDQPLPMLSPALGLAHLMAHHVLHHQFRGLLWLTDVAVVASSGRVDWTDFVLVVEKLGLKRPTHYYLTALVALLGPDFSPGLGELSDRLRPDSFRYRLFRRLNRPPNIFRARPLWGRLRAHYFRQAFK
jgi:hypothetical protein